MEKELLLGVDIGTSSSKGVLIDGDGTVLADALVEHGINIKNLAGSSRILMPAIGEILRKLQRYY